jgi:hypothetical protein
MEYEDYISRKKRMERFSTKAVDMFLTVLAAFVFLAVMEVVLRVSGIESVVDMVYALIR